MKKELSKIFVSALRCRGAMLVLLLFACCPSWAQVSDLLPASSVIAGAGVARTDCWTAFANPATLVQENSLQIACQYENRYLISELSNQLVQAAWCNRVVNVGIAYTHFGYKRYGEQLAGVVLSRSFGRRFSLGLQANYYAAYMGEELKYVGTFIPQVGATVSITDRLTLGFHSFNPFQQRLRGRLVDKPLPSTYVLGMAWHIGNNFDWMMQAEKEVSYRFRVSTGVEWQAVNLLRVKLGAYYDDYLVGCLGVGLSWSWMRFDVNCELHPVLGLCTLGRLQAAW